MKVVDNQELPAVQIHTHSVAEKGEEKAWPTDKRKIYKNSEKRDSIETTGFIISKMRVVFAHIEPISHSGLITKIWFTIIR